MDPLKSKRPWIFYVLLTITLLILNYIYLFAIEGSVIKEQSDIVDSIIIGLIAGVTISVFNKFYKI